MKCILNQHVMQIKQQVATRFEVHLQGFHFYYIHLNCVQMTLETIAANSFIT